MTVPNKDLQTRFPGLRWYMHTSDATPRYNCHAWGADRDDVWWEPMRMELRRLVRSRRVYWPNGLDLDDYSLENFQHAFGTIGFQPAEDGEKEEGIEKIALYEDAGGRISHTARQLPSGSWTSKLGEDMDMEHRAAAELEGPTYGQIVAFMKRPEQSTNTPQAGLAASGMP